MTFWNNARSTLKFKHQRNAKHTARHPSKVEKPAMQTDFVCAALMPAPDIYALYKDLPPFAFNGAGPPGIGSPVLPAVGNPQPNCAPVPTAQRISNRERDELARPGKAFFREMIQPTIKHI